MSKSYYKIVDTAISDDCLACPIVKTINMDLIPDEHLEALSTLGLFGPKLEYNTKKGVFVVDPVLYVCEIEDEDVEDMKKYPSIEIGNIVLVIENDEDDIDSEVEEGCS